MGAFLLASCSESSIYSTTKEDKPSPSIQPKATSMDGLADQRDLNPDSIKSLEDINDALSASGKSIRLSHAETVTLGMGVPQKPVKPYTLMTVRSVSALNGCPAMKGEMLMVTI